MSSLSLLLQLIEQLPVPLSVRNRHGHVLGTNQSWRVQPQHPPTHLTYTQLTGTWSDLQLISTRHPPESTSVDRLKTEFLACIDHELKTPLTSVIGIASLLNQQTLGALNQKQRRYVQMIHQSGRHLMEIINMIVDLAQVESGQLALEPEPLEISSVCQASIKQTQKWLEQEAWLNKRPVPPIQFHLDVADSLDICTADVARLQQMLAHLLSNACKFSYSLDQEQVPVHVSLTVGRWGQWLAFTVIDRGIGIADHQQHLIFQRFQQVDSSLVRCYGGTGLGLVLTRQLARLHGGDVTFTSQSGLGSKFTILLPYDRHDRQLTPTARELPQLVLIAETVPSHVDRLSQVIETAGYRVVVARNGMEAIEKMRQLQPFASIINAQLPMLSGWDVQTVMQGQITLMVADDMGTIADSMVTAFLARAHSKYLREQNQRPPTILYIRKFLMENTTHTLADMGYSLIEAADVEQAHILIQIWQPDLLVTDRACPPNLLGTPCLVISPDSTREAINQVITSITKNSSAA